MLPPGRGIAGIPYNPASVAFIEQSEAYFSMVNYLAGHTAWCTQLW